MSTYGVLGALGPSIALTLASSLMGVWLSIFVGARIAAMELSPVTRWALLTLLFLPFAMGSGIWAFSWTYLIKAFNLQSELLQHGQWIRGITLFLLCELRFASLGIFFVATSLSLRAASMANYLSAHAIDEKFSLRVLIASVPKSVIVLIGMFIGASMAQEGALPQFLYRANPGTAPETQNITLLRTFREVYSSLGIEALPSVSVAGLIMAAIHVAAAAAGTALALKFAQVAANVLLKESGDRVGDRRPRIAVVFDAFLCGALLANMVAWIFAIAPAVRASTVSYSAMAEYFPIMVMGLVVGITLVLVTMSTAIAARYNYPRLWHIFRTAPAAQVVLMLPAFIPILTIVSMLSFVTHGSIGGASGFVAAFLCHFALHFSVFQFVFASTVEGNPLPHVLWHKDMNMPLWFTIGADGLARHFPICVSMTGLGLVAVMTDGSIARWFSHLIASPDDALQGALFGRTASFDRAASISSVVSFIALAVSTTLSRPFVLPRGGR